MTVANNRTSQTVPKSKQWIAQICIPLFNVPALTVRLSYRLHPDVLSSVLGGRARQAIQTTGLSSHRRAGCWYTQCLILGKYTTAWCDIGSHFPSHSDPPFVLACARTANGKSCYAFFSCFFSTYPSLYACAQSSMVMQRARFFYWIIDFVETAGQSVQWTVRGT